MSLFKKVVLPRGQPTDHMHSSHVHFLHITFLFNMFSYVSVTTQILSVLLHHFIIHCITMSSIPLPFNWSKQLEYNWCTVEGIEKLWHLVGPYLPYAPSLFQLRCTARMMNGWDIHCLSATGDSKSALIHIYCTKRHNYLGSMPYEPP